MIDTPEPAETNEQETSTGPSEEPENRDLRKEPEPESEITPIPNSERMDSTDPAQNQKQQENEEPETQEREESETQETEVSETQDPELSVRYTRLTQISERSVIETIKLLTFPKLAACYPTIAATASGQYVLQQALAQIAKFFETSALREFSTIFEERNIAELFKQLDVLVAEARERKEKHSEDEVQKEASEDGADAPVFLESLTPETIVSAHLAPIQLDKISSLQAELARLKQENATSAQTLLHSNAKAKSLLQSIQDMASDLVEKAEPIRTAPLPSRNEIIKAINSMTYDVQMHDLL